MNFALAVTKGIIEKDEFYIEILNTWKIQKSKVKALCDIIYGNKNSDKKENNPKVMEFLKKEGQKVIDYILETEFKRGETPVESFKYNPSDSSCKRNWQSH